MFIRGAELAESVREQKPLDGTAFIGSAEFPTARKHIAHMGILTLSRTPILLRLERDIAGYAIEAQ